MSAPFVAEIRIFGFHFAPTGWAFCNGQLLPISQNTALFSLIGTSYGGNGKSTFARAFAAEHLQAALGCISAAAGVPGRWRDRRQPAAQQHDALPDAQLLHCAP